MVIYLFTASPATLLLLSLQRVPSSSSTVQGGPSSTTPVLLSCVDSFDTAPPPRLAPLCLLSSVDFFDTAPPPQDLLAGLLYTAPPPSTGVHGLHGDCTTAMLSTGALLLPARSSFACEAHSSFAYEAHSSFACESVEVHGLHGDCTTAMLSTGALLLPEHSGP
ncbi:uncharacterized protein UDID_18988 [Ustilago sp. UG-2017a]|nr:uncharacterized protein UDID_18988 [Ustilago sp. UG-2017a]